MMERRVDRDAMESASREVSAGARQLAAKGRGGGWTGREREAHVRGFVERHQGAVLNFLRFQVPDADRGDVASQVFQIAAERLAGFVVAEGRERGAAERCWVLAIARNVAANWRRKHREVESLALEDVRTPGDIERDTAAFELARALLWTLPEALRTIYLWHHLEGMTHEEIAEQLGAPLGTIKTRLRAAQAELDDKIDRLCAREKTERGDYLRGALPFFQLEEPNQALRGAEKAAQSAPSPPAWLGLVVVTSMAVVGAVDGVAYPGSVLGPEGTPSVTVAAHESSMSVREGSRPPSPRPEAVTVAAEESSMSGPASIVVPGTTAVSAAPAPARPASRPAGMVSTGRLASSPARTVSTGTAASSSPLVSSSATSMGSPAPPPAVPSVAATASVAPAELSEADLIRLARRAMHEGSPQRARVFLLRHGRAYPHGSLAPEREVLLRRLSAR